MCDVGVEPAQSDKYLWLKLETKRRIELFSSFSSASPINATPGLLLQQIKQNFHSWVGPWLAMFREKLDTLETPSNIDFHLPLQQQKIVCLLLGCWC